MAADSRFAPPGPRPYPRRPTSGETHGITSTDSVRAFRRPGLAQRARAHEAHHGAVSGHDGRALGGDARVGDFAPGDRVMETQNDYDRDVFNGDLGMVARIDEEEGAVVVTFDGREVVYPYGELDTLVPAFATTIPKSQGSEYPAVVIPIVTQHFNMLARNLLYTGVTRGK